MTVYDNDPRVRQIDDYRTKVHTDDKYDVYAWSSTDRWYTVPGLTSNAVRSANLPSREETEAWLLRMRTGPFPSRDAAIASLIGEMYG